MPTLCGPHHPHRSDCPPYHLSSVTKHRIHGTRSRCIVVIVEVFSNASAMCPAPTSPIWFSTTSRRMRPTRHLPQTVHPDLCNRCVLLQCLCDVRRAVIADQIPQCISCQHTHTPHNRSHPRCIVVMVVFFSRAHAICAAPASPISLPITLPSIVQYSPPAAQPNFRDCRVLLQSPSDVFCASVANLIAHFTHACAHAAQHRIRNRLPRYIFVTVLFFSNARPIHSAPATPIPLSCVISGWHTNTAQHPQSAAYFDFSDCGALLQRTPNVFCAAGANMVSRSILPHHTPTASLEKPHPPLRCIFVIVALFSSARARYLVPPTPMQFPV